jgi:hypothetical protein
VVAGDRRAETLDTLAEVENYRGDSKNALAIEDQALTMASAGNRSALERNRKRFETGAPSPEVDRERERLDGSPHESRDDEDKVRKS